MAAFAIYFHSMMLLLCAFVEVCGFRLYENWYQGKWMPIWSSIIQKFEAEMNSAHLADAGSRE